MNFLEIGQRIKQRRKSLNLTQLQLADMVGLTESSISRYENGKIETMPTSTVKKICQVLNMEVADLLGLDYDTFEYDLKEIISMADKFPSNIKTELLHIIKLQVYLIGGAYID